MEEGQTHKSMGGVEVLVTAGAEPAQPPDQQNEDSEQKDMGTKLSFLQRAGRRLRNSVYMREPMRASFYRDSLMGGDADIVEATTCTTCGVARLQLVPLRWRQVVCDKLDTLSWNVFILLITLFSVFAPDISIYYSASDNATEWINGFMVAAMAVFFTETLLNIACRNSVHPLTVLLEMLSTLSLLFAITWFTDAVDAKQDGTTSDAARACRILRLMRIVTVLQILGTRLKQCYFRNNPEAAAAAADQLAPTNIGRKIGEITTLQNGMVVVATVICTSLLTGADISTGSTLGLDAFVASLAAAAAAGSTAAQLQPLVDAMLDFSKDDLQSKQVPMFLEVAGVGTWDWVDQHGGWSERSTDRDDLLQGPVSLAVDVSGANHDRALFNMLLALTVTLLLLVFVCALNYTIWKMLVQPLDRIFHTIRTNAAQVVRALGTPEDRAAAQADRPHGRGSGLVRCSSALDIGTIEAAVSMMSRILEQYTSAGGVGLNTVKKMASGADQSTKEWLASMVAGPASEELASGRSPSLPNTANNGARSLSPPSVLGRAGAGPGMPHAQRPRLSLQQRVLGFGGQPQGQSGQPRRSRLGRMSEANAADLAKLAALAADSSATPEEPHPQPMRRSSLTQFIESTNQSEASEVDHSGPTSPTAAGAPAAAAPSTDQGPKGTLGVAFVDSAPAAVALLPLSSAASDAAALAAAAKLHHRACTASGLWASAAATCLPEAQRKLLRMVDLDYLHSFSFDVLSVPQPLLPAYVCAMFLELELAFFGGEDSAHVKQPAEQEGYVDVATLWRFVDEVASIYRTVVYHNFFHCVDVTHTTFMFIKRVSHKVNMTDLEKFALMVAAVSHDLDHPGVNNAFLVNSKDGLATTYNDNSVLENRHVACLYGLLLRKPHIDIFARLDPTQWREVRKMVIGSVLATDMVHHFPMVSRLEVFYELHATNIQAHHRALRRGHARDSLPRLFDTAEERQQLLNLLLHCADISNPIKPSDIAEKWADKVLGEFFSQGDKEKAAGLPISPMCDRDKTSRAQSQINFIEFVVVPIYAQVYKIFPELGETMDNLIANRHFWHDALLQELAALPEGGGGSAVFTGSRAEEVAKAEKRLRDFQDKYRDIVSKRRSRLEALATQNSLACVAPNSTPAALLRHNSLAALIAEATASGAAPLTVEGSSRVTGGSKRSSATPGSATGILGGLFHRSTTRGNTGGTAGTGSGRSSNASVLSEEAQAAAGNAGQAAAAAAAAATAAAAAAAGAGAGGKGGSFSAGCLPNGSKVAPDDGSKADMV